MTTRLRTQQTIWCLLLVVVVLVGGSLSGLDVTLQRLRAGIPHAGSLLSLMFLHPSWAFWPTVITGLRESLQIAALGTFLAAFLALPFGTLAARNLSRLLAVSFFGKLCLNAIRTFPEIILAIAFIKSLGPGPLAGVLAVSVHSVGMIGKLYAERIESVDSGPLEALRAAGASPLEVFRFGIIPEVFPDFLSFVLYRFDLNVRSASVLGLVGAGGIGTALDLQRNGDNWPNIGVILIGITVTVGLVDYLSGKLRARLT